MTSLDMLTCFIPVSPVRQDPLASHTVAVVLPLPLGRSCPDYMSGVISFFFPSHFAAFSFQPAFVYELFFRRLFFTTFGFAIISMSQLLLFAALACVVASLAAFTTLLALT